MIFHSKREIARETASYIQHGLDLLNIILLYDVLDHLLFEIAVVE